MKLNFGFSEEWKEYKKFEKLTDKERSKTVHNIGNSAKIGAEIIEKIYKESS
jgi:hypothetical protein